MQATKPLLGDHQQHVNKIASGSKKLNRNCHQNLKLKESCGSTTATHRKNALHSYTSTNMTPRQPIICSWHLLEPGQHPRSITSLYSPLSEPRATVLRLLLLLLPGQLVILSDSFPAVAACQEVKETNWTWHGWFIHSHMYKNSRIN
jgi:hypothetical protein